MLGRYTTPPRMREKHATRPTRRASIAPTGRSVPARVAEAAVGLPAAPAALERAGREGGLALADRAAAPGRLRPRAAPFRDREDQAGDQQHDRRDPDDRDRRRVDVLQRR